MLKSRSETESLVARPTGRQVEVLVHALLNAANDKVVEVQDAIRNALIELGKNHPALLLESSLSFLVKNLQQLSQTHRIAVLNVIEVVVREKSADLSEQLAADIVKQVAIEMTASKDVVPEWQTAASHALVAIGEKYCNLVMDELIQRFQPGVLPHFFVIQTMAKLAISNVYSMVPFLPVVLATMLPMLGMAKQDNMKWVFADAISKFSAAILDYVANLDQAPDKSVRKELFSNEFFSTYDMLYNVWLPNAKDSKLRAAIVDALGQASHIMKQELLQEQLPKLIPGILALYRKHPDQLPLTQSLCLVLDAATANGCIALDPLLELLLNSLYGFISTPIDVTNAFSVKNQNELLRCFSMIVRSFSDKVVAFLVARMEQNNEKTRIGTLLIVKHLINSGGSAMEAKKALVVSGLKVLLSETNNKVKKVLAQVVSAMAHHGYLELEGGELMVEFIVKQCALPDDAVKKPPPGDPDYVSNQSLRVMCESVLQLVTSTVEIMEQVLWPYILEFVVPVQFTDALGVVCKNMALVAQKKRQSNDEDYLIDYDAEANLPRPEEIMVRLIVMTGHPQLGRRRGANILSAMLAISPNLKQEIVPIWDNVIPKLLQHLEGDDAVDDAKWNQSKWEDLILKFLAKSLDAVADEEWLANLGQVLGKQITLYQNYPEEKGFAFKCLGVMMRKSTKKDFVQSHLKLVFSSVNQSSPVEREGCALAFGFAAASHLDAVLTKLEEVAKPDSAAKKSTSFLDRIKEAVKSEDSDTDRSRPTAVLCYGYATLYAPLSLVTSRVEAVVLRNLNPHLGNQKDVVLKQSVIKSLELIGRTMHPLHLQQTYPFTHRTQLLNYLLACLKSEPPSVLTAQTRELALRACAAFIKLEPKLPDAEAFEIVKTSLDCSLNLVAPSSSKAKGDAALSDDDADDTAQLLTPVFEALHEVMKDLLLKDMSSDGLDALFKHVAPWLVSLQDHERLRAILLTKDLLTCYLENVAGSHPQEKLAFVVVGSIAARLVPRCTDPVLEVRQNAVMTMQVLLRIQLVYNGVAVDEPDIMVDALDTLAQRLEKNEPNVFFSVANDLSKVLSKKVPADNGSGEQLLLVFVNILLDGLADAQSYCSSGACVVLNGVMKLRGNELQGAQVADLIGALHVRLSDISNAQTRTGTLRCVRTIATHHFLPVVEALLSESLPYHPNVVEFWQELSRDPVLCQSTFDYCLDVLNRQMPYEEKPDPADHKQTIRIATQKPLAVISALQHIFEVQDASTVVSENYHSLFAALLLKLGSAIGAKPPAVSGSRRPESTAQPDKFSSTFGNRDRKQAHLKPVEPLRICIDAIKQFLVSSQSTEICQEMNDNDHWSRLTTIKESIGVFEAIACALAKSQPSVVPKLINALSPALSNLYELDRIVVTTFFAELINQRCGSEDMGLVELLVSCLMGRLMDSSHQVRMLCIRGLGNVGSTGTEMVQKYSTTVLSAMMSGMDDKDDLEDDITLEAMSGLSKLLGPISETHIRPILINIALKIRPCFEKNKPAVRAAAFRLFGNLAKFGDGPSRLPFLEQLHANFVSLLLHLNDKEREVVKACKFALKELGELLNAPSINDMFLKYLAEDGQLHYGEFMNDLSKEMVVHLSDKVTFYIMTNVSFFKSQWSEIKGNAAIFLGFLMSAVPKDRQGLVNKEHVCNALTSLLKDSNASVRVKAAEAMSLLYGY